MPRGPVGGATAALIQALAGQGVSVSAYQIERWRTAGALPRPKRHGRGRGKGVVSEPPDESTVQRALVLARASRRGSRRFGVHPIERVALGLPVADDVFRRAIGTVLTQISAMFGTDAGDDDIGWQTRNDIAARLPHTAPFGLQELVDAVDEVPWFKSPLAPQLERPLTCGNAARGPFRSVPCLSDGTARQCRAGSAASQGAPSWSPPPRLPPDPGSEPRIALRAY